MIHDPPLSVRWWLRLLARRHGLLLRVLILASALVAIAGTRAATGEPVLAIELAAVILALVAAAYPDTHVGLVVVGLIGVDWLVAVDDPTTPWSIAVAISLALLHTSMAAASVAPPAALWTAAMRRRWTRRFAMVAATSVPAWSVASLITQADIPSSAALLTAALLTLAAAGLWARYGHLSAHPPG